MILMIVISLVLAAYACATFVPYTATEVGFKLWRADRVRLDLLEDTITKIRRLMYAVAFPAFSAGFFFLFLAISRFAKS